MRDKAKAFVANLYHHVPVLDSGARGSTITFTKRGIGDVLLSWENEAHLALKETPGQYEIVYPSPLHPGRAAGGAGGQECRPPRHPQGGGSFPQFPLHAGGAGDRGQGFLSSPRSGGVLAKYKSQFPNIPLATIDGDFGGWDKAQATHFADGGVFDQIYQPGQMSATGIVTP